jgi:hypothetical protein
MSPALSLAKMGLSFVPAWKKFLKSIRQMLKERERLAKEQAQVSQNVLVAIRHVYNFVRDDLADRENEIEAAT